MTTLTFGLPGSLGTAAAVQRAFLLEEHLTAVLHRPFTVRVCPSYDDIERDLISGELSAAWGPPLVCARVEAQGGQVAVRGIRSGSASYRAVLVGLKERKLTLEAGVHLRAAWVDKSSISGYLLPRALLAERGVVLDEASLGSYQAALEAVLEGKADLTATWASAASVAVPYSGYRELLGERADRLEVLGYTQECPNDAIVFSPHLGALDAQAVWGAFLDLSESPEGLELSREVFGTEHFAAAPAEEYRQIGALFARL